MKRYTIFFFLNNLFNNCNNLADEIYYMKTERKKGTMQGLLIGKKMCNAKQLRYMRLNHSKGL